MRRLLLAIALVPSLTAPAFARDADIDHPDLSGDWVLNLAKSKPREGTNLTLTCGAYTTEIGETIADQKIVLTDTPDGKDAPVATFPGGQIIAKAYWKKGWLFAEVFGAQTTPGEDSRWAAAILHQTQRWTLSSDGKVLTREIDGGKDILVYGLQPNEDTEDSEPPDLSGTWKVNREASGLTEDADAGSETIPIVCLGSVTRKNVNTDTTDQWQTLETDGVDHTAANSEPGQLILSAYWDKSARVTSSTIYWGVYWVTGDSMHLTERWTVSRDGLQLFRQRQIAFAAGTTPGLRQAARDASALT